MTLYIFAAGTILNFIYGIRHRSSIEKLLNKVHTLDSEELLQYENSDIRKRHHVSSKVSSVNTLGQFDIKVSGGKHMTFNKDKKCPTRFNLGGPNQSAEKVSKVPSNQEENIYFKGEILPELAFIRKKILKHDHKPLHTPWMIVSVIVLRIALSIVMGATSQLTMLINYAPDKTRNIAQSVCESSSVMRVSYCI